MCGGIIPHAAYGLVEWDVILESNGDVFDKIMVRIREMFESDADHSSVFVPFGNRHGCQSMPTRRKSNLAKGSGITRRRAEKYFTTSAATAATGRFDTRFVRPVT